MTKWILACGALLIAVVYLLLQLGDQGPTRASVAEPARSFEPSRARGSTAFPTVRSDRDDDEADDDGQDDDDGGDEPSGLSPNELMMRLDNVYPDRYYASIASRCDSSSAPSDASAHLEYQLRIVRGEVLATNVRVVDSNLGDTALEQCLVSSLEQARWRDDEMPDMDEPRDFYFRVKAQKKFLSDQRQAEFDEQRRRDDDDGSEDADDGGGNSDGDEPDTPAVELD